MKPAILQWKVMLALLAVVIVGTSLGSALHPDGRSPRTFYTYGINRPQVGGWTGYTPYGPNGKPTAAQIRLERMDHTLRKAERNAQLLKQPSLLVCEAWRTELRSGRVPKGWWPRASWTNLLSSHLSECHKYLS